MCLRKNLAIDFRMADLRAGIVRLWQEGMKQCDIVRSMDIPKQTVSKAIQRFRETGINADRPRSGRPITATTRQNIQRVKRKICHCTGDDEGHIHSKKGSARKIAKQLGIGRDAAHRMIVDALGMKSRKTREGQLLSDDVKNLRVTRAKKLLRRFANDRHRRILFTDEKWFNVEQSHNSQNDRIWRRNPLPPELKIVERTQKPKQVMVWAGVHWSGRTELIFVPEGVKVNGPVYRKMLKDQVLPWSEEYFGDKEWTFQQDGAPSHRASETQDWIAENFKDFIKVDTHWTKRDGEWAPNSPDWTVLDYFAWPFLESKACSKPHKSVAALKASLVKEWNEIPQEMFQKAIDDFPKRLRKCIAAHGGHFE